MSTRIRTLIKAFGVPYAARCTILTFAGVEGLEPPTTVLETGMIPLHHTPIGKFLRYSLVTLVAWLMIYEILKQSSRAIGDSNPDLLVDSQIIPIHYTIPPIKQRKSEEVTAGIEPEFQIKSLMGHHAPRSNSFLHYCLYFYTEKN